MNTSATPSCLSSGMSSAGIVPPTVTSTSSTPCSLEQLDDPRHERHVRARQDRQADRVGVLLDDGLDDLLGRLVQARVDHLHAGVAQRARDDLRAAVVAVEAGLGDDDADLLLVGAAIERCAVARGRRDRRGRRFYGFGPGRGRELAPRPSPPAHLTVTVSVMNGWIVHIGRYVPLFLNVTEYVPLWRVGRVELDRSALHGHVVLDPCRLEGPGHLRALLDRQLLRLEGEVHDARGLRSAPRRGPIRRAPRLPRRPIRRPACACCYLRWWFSVGPWTLTTPTRKAGQTSVR